MKMWLNTQLSSIHFVKKRATLLSGGIATTWLTEKILPAARKS
jgi:hypothetical protein